MIQNQEKMAKKRLQSYTEISHRQKYRRKDSTASLQKKYKSPYTQKVNKLFLL